MLEISQDARLVRHSSGAGHRWQLQQRIDRAAYTRREMWRPVDRLMDAEQTLLWLSASAAPLTTIEHFRAVAGLR